MMKHRLIVTSLWYTKNDENPKLNLNDNGFEVPTECITWKSFGSETLTACVNSFGFGGTNAHAVIVENLYCVVKKLMQRMMQKYCLTLFLCLLMTEQVL
jgi:acyl transferase domain-containing protein